MVHTNRKHTEKERREKKQSFKINKFLEKQTYLPKPFEHSLDDSFSIRCCLLYIKRQNEQQPTTLSFDITFSAENFCLWVFSS